MSIHPLRRVAELLHRWTEWWLFKAVWILSVSMLSCLVGIVWSYSVRSSVFGLFRFWLSFTGNHRGGSVMNSRLELLEASVLVLLPFGIFSGICRLGGDLSVAVSQVLICQAVAEILALATMRAEESRYMFPRALLLVYFAHMYYMIFHPFGYIRQLHSVLCCFQAFLAVVLWSHFEVAVPLPLVCPDQLTVEVRLRPGVRAGKPSTLSTVMQQLLLEQGLLLLGDDRSHESAVVMSAVIMRALQTSSPLVAPPPQEGLQLTAEDEEVFIAADVDLLAAGAIGKVLVEHARGGDARCMALVHHLVKRLPRRQHLRRNEVLRWLLQHNENDALWVLSAVANARPHLLAETVPGHVHFPPPPRRVMVMAGGDNSTVPQIGSPRLPPVPAAQPGAGHASSAVLTSAGNSAMRRQSPVAGNARGSVSVMSPVRISRPSVDSGTPARAAALAQDAQPARASMAMRASAATSAGPVRATVPSSTAGPAQTSNGST